MFHSTVQMASLPAASNSEIFTLLSQMQNTLQTIQQDYMQLSAAVDTINGRVNILSGVKQVRAAAEDHDRTIDKAAHPYSSARDTPGLQSIISNQGSLSLEGEKTYVAPEGASPMTSARRTSTTSRIILTTYPGQSGIDPLAMIWGHKDPMQRGPVVVSRNRNTIRRRNGMSLVDVLRLRGTNMAHKSNWRPRWLILNISCPCGCQQGPRC